MDPDFSTMNETDVREIIVRSLLDRLGYRHGAEANIRTEVPLKYDRAFLGRKNPSKDPPLAGRADYICDVIPFGRWVIEVKAPNQNLTRDVVEQAHTYAAHPEIAALYFLVTNGREWRLYHTGSLKQPVLAWTFEETEDRILQLFNVVGPAALKKRVQLVAADAGKPLGLNLASKLRIIGGDVIYEDHVSTHPLMEVANINGLHLPITGGFVERAPDGKIKAHVEMANAMPLMRELTEAMGIGDGYDFFSAAEYISSDAEKPTIFQNFVETIAPFGTPVTVPGLGTIPSPYETHMTAFTEAIGFATAEKFQGSMRLSYEFQFSKMTPQARAAIQARFGQVPSTASMRGSGRFDIDIQ